MAPAKRPRVALPRRGGQPDAQIRTRGTSSRRLSSGLRLVLLLRSLKVPCSCSRVAHCPPKSQFTNGFASLPHLSSGRGAPASQIDARGGDKLEAATAYLARNMVFGQYR